MKKNKNTDSIITDNYQRAIHYLKANRWRLNFLRGFWCAIFLGAMLVDYGLSYDFFSRLARNELGVIPDDLLFTVKLKSCLGLSIVLLLEYSFQWFSKGFHKLLFLSLFCMILIALWNIGGAQIFPLLNDHVQNEYTTEETTSDVFSKLIGISPENTDQIKEASPNEAKLEKSIGKEGFIKSAKWYRIAFLFFSFVGLVAILNLAQNEKKAEQL
jgi:hypothetical protein